MNLLLALYKYFPYGGLQKDTARIAQSAVVRGWNVTICTTEWDGAPLEIPDGATGRIDVRLVHPRGWTNVGRMASFAEIFQRIRREFDGVSLAMNRVPGADFYFAADSCMKLALPRTPWFRLKRFLPRYRGILDQEAAVFSAQTSTKYLLICEKQRQEFSRAYPWLAPNRFLMVPPGIDSRCVNHRISEGERQEIRRSCGVEEGESLLILVGTNWHRKGVDRVLAMLTQLPPTVKFVLVGNDSPGQIRSLTQRLGVSQGRFFFAGPRKNVADYLCAADLMVHPAREEGTGTVLLEAVSCGLPVVCSAACGWAPYIGKIDSALVLSEPFDPLQMTQSVQDALANLPALRQKTAAYAASHDFTRRADAILDFLAMKA